MGVEKHSVCILHMSLRIVNGLFMNLIVNKIGESSTPNVDQVADLVKIVTKDAGAYMKESKLKAKSKNIDGEWRKVAFAGADAGKINQVHKNLLESVHPKADRDKNTATQGQWERSTTCWQQWLVVWDLLNADVRPEETIESRSRRAEVMRTEAAKFVTAWVAANGKPTRGSTCICWWPTFLT